MISRDVIPLSKQSAFALSSHYKSTGSRGAVSSTQSRLYFEHQMNSDQSFGVYCDEDNKLHYYNCAPVKPKQRKHKPVENPVKKLINKVFRKQDSTGTSGSELSLASNTKK